MGLEDIRQVAERRRSSFWYSEYSAAYQSIVLAKTMLANGIANLGDSCNAIIHSDRGCHYRWPGWIGLMERHNLTRSMSKKGCSTDNSACEGFFGRLKNEMFYGRDWMERGLDR